ncbi:MAG: hypothetical protein ABI665_14240 [Vicinamibacterales bacterium]
MAGRLGAFIVIAATTLPACEAPPDPRRTNFKIEKPGMMAQYDEKTGRLKKINIDQNKNGRIDTWSYWDATKVILIEIDKDEDGKVERWEHYDGAGNTLTRVGSSSKGDGVEDTWTYPDESGQLSRVETDTDRDGSVDKRETYVAGPGGRVISMVELEIDKSGVAARRLYYRPDGSFDRSEVRKER